MNITLCADDYALNEWVSTGIINLVKQQRLSAVSCLTNLPYWPEHSLALKHFSDQIDIGLHFNLTEGKSATPLKQLLLKSHLHLLSQADIEKSFHQQLDQFAENLGKLPDFIDGHEHIHHFPVIRNAILNVYEARLRQQRSYIRIATNGMAACLKNPAAVFKASIITLTGAVALKQLLIQRQIPHNSTFAGIYNFNNARTYANLFPEFLAQLNEGGLLMCHPGLHSDQANDVMNESRQHEYEYFSGQQFIDACAEKNVRLGKLLA